MNKKFGILGVLIVMALAICGAFSMPSYSHVFATETQAQTTNTDIAGTFEGEGSYTAGQTVTLKASMNLGYDFDCWVGTYEDGRQVRLSTEKEYSFVTDENVIISPKWKRAGVFRAEGANHIIEDDGTSFYVVGGNVTLIAEMCDGYEFLGWTTKDDEDNKSILSTNLKYSFTITDNMIITPEWQRIIYGVDFAEKLYNVKPQLKDFEYDVINNTQTNDNNYHYYNDEIQVVITIKEGSYAGVLNKNNIKINGVDLYTIQNNNPMDVKCEITNDDNSSLTGKGFVKAIITFNIQENITIDINYTNMYKLSLVSGNEKIDIANLIKFITVSGYYSKDDENFTYLVSANNQLTINVESGDEIYTFNTYKLEGLSPSTQYSTSFYLNANKTFTLYYSMKEYSIKFNSYVINQNNQLDPIDEIATIKLIPGEKIGINYSDDKLTVDYYEYNDVDGDIIVDTSTHDYITATGYKFKQFQIDDQIITDIYQLSLTQDVEIKLLFEQIKYNISVNFVDDFFADGVDYTINGQTSAELVRGSDILFTALTDLYTIAGWSWSWTTAPTLDEINSQLSTEQKFDSLNDAFSTGQVFEFVPTSDDETDCIITLDVQYKYLTATYSLSANSIVSEADDENNVSYTYFADLHIYVINEISLSLKDNNTKADVVFKGIKFTDTTTTITDIVNILDVDLTRVSETIYTLKYKGYTLEVHINNIETGIQVGDYILFPNVNYSGALHTTKFEYNGSGFVVVNSTGANSPLEISKTLTKHEGEYSLTLNNLLHNAVLMYGAKSVDANLYQIKGFRNSAGASLVRFTEGDCQYCLYPITRIDTVSVEYYKIENNVILQINNTEAYAYDNINIRITRNGIELDPSSGDQIWAEDGDEVVVIINENLITKGYKFDGFVFQDEETTATTEYKFIMIFNEYANQTIYINFSESEYTLNVVYVDDGGIQVTEPNGYLRLKGKTEEISSITIILTGEYVFEMVTEDGYYVTVNGAYLGNKLKYITSLEGSNNSNTTITTWHLNAETFEEYIINCANDDNSLNLYINLAIHTYTTKIYFSIGYNDSVISYPKLTITDGHGKASPLKTGIENNQSVIYLEVSELTYNTDVTLNLDSFMLGTTLQKWTDEKFVTLSQVNQLKIENITSNRTLHVILDYIKYTLTFESVNENGQPCTYGSGSSTTDFKLYDQLKYSIVTQNGYILKEQYYYDSEGNKGTKDIASSNYSFNPQDFKLLGTTFKIYLVFGLKEVKLDISNSVVGDLYYFAEQNPNDLAPFTVIKTSDGVTSDLTSADEYVFKTGDILTMKISPISSGIAITSVSLGNSSSSAYTLMSYNIYDQEDATKIIGYYYEVVIRFEAKLMDELYQQAQSAENGKAKIVNNLIVKSYQIKYTYNYINFKFEIQLTCTYKLNGGDKTVKGNKDSIIQFNNGFGMKSSFYCSANGLDNGVGSNFEIKGYSINGIRVNTDEKYTLTDINLWEQIALDRYIKNSNTFDVELILIPKISLQNYDKPYMEENGYIYSREYAGQNQGLITTGDTSRRDVVIGGQFEATIKYSYDGGLTFSDIKPIDFGEYPVRIIAIISAEGVESINVEFEEKVTFRITPKTLTLSLNYNSLNPLTKTYDGLRTIPASNLLDKMQLGGIYERDINKIRIDVNKLTVKFSGIDVNSLTQLYDVTLENVYLLDQYNNESLNYKLTVKPFEKIGKVNPRPLKIVGIPEIKKVNDGSTEIEIDLSKISYTGQLSNVSTPEIIIDNLKFYHDEVDADFSGIIQGKIDWSEALISSYNYTVEYDDFDVKIYPYQLEYHVNEYGTFKIIDLDKKCLIPMGSKMLAGVYSKGSNIYRSLYSVIEPEMSRGEKLHYCYEVVLQVNSVNQVVPEGLYISLPKVNKTSKIIQLPNSNNPYSLDFTTQNNETLIKVEGGKALFSLLVKTTYLPLWIILLIIVLSLVVVGLVIGVIIIIRRKTKNKYKKYDTI